MLFNATIAGAVFAVAIYSIATAFDGTLLTVGSALIGV